MKNEAQGSLKGCDSMLLALLMELFDGFQWEISVLLATPWERQKEALEEYAANRNGDSSFLETGKRPALACPLIQQIER